MKFTPKEIILFIPNIRRVNWTNASGCYLEFDGDQKGNSRYPYLCFRFYKKYAKIHKASQIHKDEKALIFPYCDFDFPKEYAKYLAGFVRSYYKSFTYLKRPVNPNSSFPIYFQRNDH